TGFTVLSVDLSKTYNQFLALVKQANPQGADGFATLEEVIHQQFGFELRKDLLVPLGPKLAFYAQAAAADAGADPATAMMLQFTGLTLSAQVRDEPALA